MANEYNIVTMADLVNVVTAENFDNIMEDISGWLHFCLAMKTIAGAIGDEKDMTMERFVWIDDGKHDKTITINVKEKDSNGE